MGRKRKAENDVKIAKEGNTSNATSETENAKEKKGFNANELTVVESINVKNYMASPSNGLSGKNKVVRRSGRFNNFVGPYRSQVVEPVVVRLNLVEDEKEEQPHHTQVNTLPVSDTRSVDEKIEYLVQAIDGIKSEVSRITKEVPSNEFGYKRMYISSQKKIESMIEENFRLAMKLEFARGKIEAYESMKDAMHTTKDVMLYESSPRKTMENAVGNCTSLIGTLNAPDVVDHETSPKKKFVCKKSQVAARDVNKPSKQNMEKKKNNNKY